MVWIRRSKPILFPKFHLIPIWLYINHVIGMSHGKEEPMESGRYHDII